MNLNQNGYILVVHAGAGKHSVSNEKQVKDAMKKALIQGQKIICNAQKSANQGLLVKYVAVDAVCQAVQVLEQSEITNAGIGSSLTLERTVECDASISNGKTGSFGAVGALQGVYHPIKVATALLKDFDGWISDSKALQEETVNKSQLVPSMVLVADGAKNYARNRLLMEVNSNLITSKTAALYDKYIKMVDTNYGRASQVQLNDFMETVGAICFDFLGNSAAASSSGGSWLKASGRLGAAATFGSACYANENGAAAASGLGEALIVSALSRTVVQRYQDYDAEMNSFLETLFGETGYIQLKRLHDSLYFSWEHTTRSMAIGILVNRVVKSPEGLSNRTEMHLIISRKPQSEQAHPHKLKNAVKGGYKYKIYD